MFYVSQNAYGTATSPGKIGCEVVFAFAYKHHAKAYHQAHKAENRTTKIVTRAGIGMVLKNNPQQPPIRGFWGIENQGHIADGYVGVVVPCAEDSALPKV